MSKKILLIIGIVILIAVVLFFVFGVKSNENEGGNIGFSLRDY